MINVHRRLKESPDLASMLLQIHDELVFEAPAENVDALVNLAKHEMEHALDVSVPIVVDVKVGDNWLDAK
jgi:DNA polymerase I